MARSVRYSYFLILISKSVFEIYFLDQRFDRGPDVFGEGLDAFMSPTQRCTGFLSSVPMIEVRLYVSVYYINFLLTNILVYRRCASNKSLSFDAVKW